MNNPLLSAIYYPFSRCIDASSLKQLLLVFENVTFLDPVADDDWRASLMEELVSSTDLVYKNYRNIHNLNDELRALNAINIIKPSIISESLMDLSAVSALSDLTNDSWCRIGSKPDLFNMPHDKSRPNGDATWNIFKPKLPDLFIDKLEGESTLSKHILRKGTANSNWTLTYEAGSAISISLHLAAAEQLSLVPVTDSIMHHQLLLHKSMRQHYGDQDRSALPLPQKAVEQLIHQTAFALVQQLLPSEFLSTVKLQDVVKFRNRILPYRNELILDLKQRFELCKSRIEPEELNQLQSEIKATLLKELNDFQNSIASARDAIWPGALSSLNKGLLAGGLSAVVFNFIAGPEYLLAASIFGSSVAFLKEMIDINNKVKCAKRTSMPSIAFLSNIQKIRN